MRAEAQIGVRRLNVTRDYHLHNLLAGTLAGCAPGHRVAHRATGEEIALLGLGGGTALTNGYHVSERYSEDLDFGVLLLADEFDKKLQEEAKKSVRWLLDAAARERILKPEIRVGKGVTALTVRVHVERADAPFLKADIAVEPAIEGMLRNGQVVSLMGRVATAEEIEEFPELGELVVPLLGIETIAANKFHAQHSRAVHGNLAAVQHRLRDVYDIASIARSEYAEQVREALAWLSEEYYERAWQHRRGVSGSPRPTGGWGTSPVFTPGTEANRAARDAWDHPVLQEMIWGWRPSFDEAIELARSLDLAHG